MFGAFRVVCSNGLVVGEKFFQGSAVHSIGSNRDSILIDLDEALHRFSTQTGIWKGWLKKELSLAHLNSAEEIGLTKENHDYIVEETSNNPKIDLWTFYNLMTFVITHRMQSLNRQVQSWNRLRTETSAW
jgi:hypothetical protein